MDRTQQPVPTDENGNYGDRLEIDFKQVVNDKFARGEGILTLSADMPDQVLLLALRNALAASNGKSFVVIPNASGR